MTGPERLAARVTELATTPPDEIRDPLYAELARVMQTGPVVALAADLRAAVTEADR